MIKQIKNKINRGVTLVELVVTMAVATILVGILTSFIYFFVTTSQRLNNYSKTVENANLIAFYIRDFIDQRNDGSITVPDSDLSVLLSYNDNNLTFDNVTDELKYGDAIIYVSEDKSLDISKKWFEEDKIIRFDISYDDGNRSLSFVKEIY